MKQTKMFIYLQETYLRLKVLAYNEISSYDLINAGEMVSLEGAIEKFQENLKK